MVHNGDRAPKGNRERNNVEQDFPHDELDREIDAIAGHYVLTAEHRVPYGDRELLYLVGHAVVDTSCCGVGGCGYALVPGFLLGYKERTDDHGRPVSRVEPIRDQALQAEIQRFVLQREQVTQCNFL